MKIIDSALEAKLEQATGIQKIIVVGIKWDGITYTYYSTVEFDFIDGEVCYPYINSVSGLENIARTDKFGEYISTEVSFSDTLGHFKEKVDTIEILDKAVEATVYLFVNADPDDFGFTKSINQMLELNKGVISDLVWDESDRVLDMTITSDFNIEDVGFIPRRTFVDDSDPDAFYMQNYMNEEMWPHVFGSVKNMLLTKLVDVPKGKIAADKSGTGDGVTSFEIEDYENFPQSTTLILEIFGRYETTFSILARGSFTGSTFNVTDFNLPRYEDIDITKLTPSTFQIDGSPTDIPWLEYSFLRLELATGNVNTVCIKQEDDVCTIRHSISQDFVKVISAQRMWGNAHPGISFSWRIKKGTVVKLYSTNTTQEAWIRSRIYVLNTDDEAGILDELLLIREAGNVTIPAASYDVFTTNGTDVNRLYIPSGDPHPACTYVRLKENAWERLIPEQEEFKDFISAEAEEPIADITTTISLDEDVLEFLVELYTSYTYTKGTESSTNRTLGFSLHDQENAATLIPSIARQQTKLIHVSGGIVTTVPLILDGDFIGLDPNYERSVYTFNKSNIQNGSLKLTTTTLDELVTKHTLRFLDNNWLSDEEVIILETNIDKYGKREKQEEYFTNVTRAAAVTTQEDWASFEAYVYFILEFESYIETIKLEVNDIVKIDLADLVIDWHVPDNALPFQRYHTVSAADDTFVGTSINGLIKSAALDMSTGLISYKVWVPRQLGDK
jgi:hypothetical protein